jgi:sporadic carbohydrate cluster 2OG-Fe(II) oxygenase
MNFLTKKEQKVSNDFIKKGYLINKAENNESLNYILKVFDKTINKILKKKIKDLNYLHKYISVDDLNEFRMELYHKVNEDKNVRFHYFRIAGNSLFTIAGNELMMQNKLNISIQFPNDSTSLLPIHSDAWQGNSPYEATLWVPLVNCYKTKSMFIMNGKYRYNFFKDKNFFLNNSGDIYKILKNKLKWLKINKGQFLLFDHTLPHGNIVNIEKQTRISINCRFKSVFSPYKNKKIAEYFSPISLRAMTDIGNKFESPF